MLEMHILIIYISGDGSDVAIKMNYRGGHLFIAQDFSWGIDFSKREKLLLY